MATEVAARVVGDKGTCDIAIDDTGLRPRVVLKVYAKADSRNALRDHLQAAFRDYEFATTIEFPD